MGKTIKITLMAGALLACGSYAAAAQTAYSQPAPLPGQTGTPADILTVPLGIAGAAVGTAAGVATAPFAPPMYEGRTAYEGGPAYIQGFYQHPNSPAAPAGGVSETGQKSGVAENPQDLGQ